MKAAGVSKDVILKIIGVIGTGGETATYRGDGVVNAGLDNDGTVAITNAGPPIAVDHVAVVALADQ